MELTRGIYYSSDGDPTKHNPSVERLNPFAKNQLLGSFEQKGGIESMRAFAEQLEGQILADPDRAHPLGAVGEPVSAKSLTLRMIAGWLFRPDGRIMKELVEKQGYGIRQDIIPWGDPFLTLPEEERKPNKWIRDPKNGGVIRLQAQLDYAANIFANTLHQTIEGYYTKPPFSEDAQEKLIKLVCFDLPLITGFRLQDPNTGELYTIGTVRGLEELYDLIHQTGCFADIKDRYIPPLICAIYSSHQIRRKGKKDRNIIHSRKGSTQEVIQTKTSMVFDNPEELALYGVEVDASVDDITDLERDVNLVLTSFPLYEQIGQTDFIAPTGYKVPVNLQELRSWLEQRAAMVGEQLIPFFLELLCIESDRFITVYNGKQLKQIPLVSIPKIEHYPVRELFPKFFTNKDEKQ